MITGTTPLILYGKIPAQGDFVRVNAEFREAYWFDQWLQQGLVLAKEGNKEEWNSVYNALTGMNFLLCPPASGMILLGSLIPSEDRSHREYPLWTGLLLRREDVRKEDMVALPLVFRTFFDEARRALLMVRGDGDSFTVADCVAQLRKNIPADFSEYPYEYGQFLKSETVPVFAGRCLGTERSIGPVELFLGLHRLLHPLLGRDLSKWGLVLRCPLGGRDYSINAVCYWLHSITRILKDPAPVPFLAWTPDEPLSFLYVVLRQPSPALFGQMLYPRASSGNMFRLEIDAKVANGSATDGYGSLTSVLERDSSTLGELLQAL